MPELPEVETTVRGLRAKVLERAFVDVWTDWAKSIKRPASFTEFKKGLVGKTIIGARRRAKNVILDLSGGTSMLIHMKMTGHLLHGAWKQEGGNWVPVQRGPMDDPYNRFLHVIWMLGDGTMIALSDARKFAKIELWDTGALAAELAKAGPEPLEPGFSAEKFIACFQGKTGKIKTLLMDPKVIAGVGNIYANEALWVARIHPETGTAQLSAEELKKLYEAVITVLRLGVNLGGESIVDYRRVDGTRGEFDSERKIYRRQGQPCYRCGSTIQRIVFAARSSFVCPNCQMKK